MKSIKSSKNMLAMLMFVMLFSFSDLLTFLSTSNKLDVAMLVMILLPSAYLIYQINQHDDDLPKYISLLGIASATMYVCFQLLDLVISFFSFYGGELSLYLIWDYKEVLFLAILGVLYILSRVKFSTEVLSKVVIALFTLSILVLGYLMVNLTLEDNVAINLVSFDASYTKLIAVFFPILYLSFYKVEKPILKESILLSGGLYLALVIMIMLVSNFVVYSNDSVTFVNIAFTNFIKSNTGFVFGNIMFCLYIVLELFKVGIIYVLAKESYEANRKCTGQDGLVVSMVVSMVMLIMIMLLSTNLWVMRDVVQSVFMGFGLMLLVVLSCYSIYLCFKKYIAPTTKALLLILATFPIIVCLIYLSSVESPLISSISVGIRRMNIVFFIFSLFVLFYYICETFILWYAYRKRIYTSSLEITEEQEQIDIFVLIPCMNEDLVINKTLNSLLNNDYRNLNIYVIDDASQDNTLYEIAKCVDIRKHVLKRTKPNAQLGKGEALNWAYYQLIKVIDDRGLNHNDVLITIIDADTEVEPDYFHKVSKVFKTMPQVTGLQSKVRVVDLGRDSAQDLEFAQIINSMQSLRNLTDTVAFGGNGQFCRLSTLELLDQKPWSDSLVEDFDLSIRLYLTLGNKIHNIQFDDIYIMQSGIIKDPPALVKQRVRWAQGNIQSFKYMKEIITSNKLRFLQKAELCSTLIKPWLMAIEYAILIYTLVLVVDIYIFEGLTQVLVLIIIMFIAMGSIILLINLIWSILYNKDKDGRMRVTSVVSDTYYLTKFLFTLTQIYPQSILRHLKSDNGWDKTSRQVNK